MSYHILFLRFSSLGDVILNTSLPKALKDQYGAKLSLSFLTAQEFRPVLENHPSVDNLVLFDRKKGLGHLLGKVKGLHAKKKIDLIVDLHGTLRSLAIRFLFPSIPRIFVDKRTLERSLLTTFKLDILSQQGEGDREKGFGELLLKRNLSDFAFLLSHKDAWQPLIKKEQLSSCAPLFSSEVYQKVNLGKYLVLAPSASFPEKRWEAQKFYNLAQMILKQWTDLQVVVLAGPADTFCDIFNPLETEFPQRFFNLQGKTSLHETLLILKSALTFVGNDTGVPHLAESLGVPGVFILGPTGQEFGFYPHLQDSGLVAKDLWCRPCSTNGKGLCIRRERYCLTQISEVDVMAKLKQKMEVLCA